MAGTQPHDHLIPSTEAGDSGYPAQNTRSKTPANAARAAPPKAPGAGKSRTTRAAIDLEEADNTPEDDAVPNSQPGILLPKRSRTLTASREAQEIEDRARLMAARLTLARVEKETAAFYETGENPGIGHQHRPPLRLHKSRLQRGRHSGTEIGGEYHALHLSQCKDHRLQE